MPANLSPEYKKAEQAFRSARDLRERLGCLKEMLRTIPRHKGTEHLQADLKSRIRQLTQELEAPRKGPVRGNSVNTVRHEGAAQVCLIGPPNAGKSSLHARLTGSKSEISPGGFTTQHPVPGMLAFEDIAFQLVDLPPVSAGHVPPWMPGLLQATDAVWLVVDLADAACAEQVLEVLDELARRKISLSDRWPGLEPEPVAAAETGAPPSEPDSEVMPDPFRVELPTLLVANKSDLDSDPREVAVLEELTGVRFPAIATSAQAGAGLVELAPFLFKALEIVRVYTKAIGKPFEKSRPFTLRRGATVLDVARLVHKDLADSLRFARLWGSSAFEGQQVGPEHTIADGDVVELHAG